MFIVLCRHFLNKSRTFPFIVLAAWNSPSYMHVKKCLKWLALTSAPIVITGAISGTSVIFKIGLNEADVECCLQEPDVQQMLSAYLMTWESASMCFTSTAGLDSSLRWVLMVMHTSITDWGHALNRKMAHHMSLLSTDCYLDFSF